MEQKRINDVKVGEVFSQGILYGVLVIYTGKRPYPYTNLYSMSPERIEKNNPVTIVNPVTGLVVGGEREGKVYSEWFISAGEERDSILRQLERAREMLLSNKIANVDVEACMYILNTCASGNYYAIPLEQVSYRNNLIDIKQVHLDFMVKEGYITFDSNVDGVCYQITDRGRELFVNELFVNGK